MKKSDLGITNILFSIMVEASRPGYFAYVPSGTGLIGLIIAVCGCFEKK